MYVTASDTVNVPVEFENSQGQLAVPDAGSFTYTVFRLDGSVVQAQLAPTLGATATEYSITLTSPTTTKVSLEDSETLLLRIKYAHGGVTKTQRVYLTLIDEPRYIITDEDVRNALGATDLILTDDMIDLHQTYVAVKNSSYVGTIDFDAVLIGGGYNAQLANDALKYAAAASAITKLRITLIKTHTEDNISVTHFETNLDALGAEMAAKYVAAMSELNPQLRIALTQVSDLFVVSTPAPDLITGA